jgi:endonuclease/exonuclease/phosphatase family metal-dependent hydrolase
LVESNRAPQASRLRASESGKGVAVALRNPYSATSHLKPNCGCFNLRENPKMRSSIYWTAAYLMVMACGDPSPIRADQLTSLRVMTYNVHHCEGVDGQLDIERIAKIIKDQKCDLVALQEIDRLTARSQQIDQIERLAELTGMRPYFGKAIDYAGGAYGVGILSNLPVTEHKTTPLPTGGNREPRIALQVVVQPAEGEPFVFVCTHLDHSSGENDRGRQTAELRKLFGDSPRPAILAGDFNSQIDRPEMATIAEKWTDVDAVGLKPTIPVSKPTRKIDFIFLQHNSPWSVESSQVLQEPLASDHLPLVAALRWKP